MFERAVGDVPETMRGDFVFIGSDTETAQNLTSDLRSGTTNYQISFP